LHDPLSAADREPGLRFALAGSYQSWRRQAGVGALEMEQRLRMKSAHLFRLGRVDHLENEICVVGPDQEVLVAFAAKRSGRADDAKAPPRQILGLRHGDRRRSLAEQGFELGRAGYRVERR
jgi:hypothetical protein